MSSVHAIPFTDTCGACGHGIERPMPATEYENTAGIWVACGQCGHRNWATKD